MQVDDRTDVRLQKPWDEQEKEWTYEEIFKLITLDGTAANPADVVMKVHQMKRFCFAYCQRHFYKPHHHNGADASGQGKAVRFCSAAFAWHTYTWQQAAGHCRLWQSWNGACLSLPTGKAGLRCFRDCKRVHVLEAGEDAWRRVILQERGSSTRVPPGWSRRSLCLRMSMVDHVPVVDHASGGGHQGVSGGPAGAGWRVQSRLQAMQYVLLFLFQLI